MQQTPQKPRILFCNPVIHARDVYEALCSVAQKVTVESKSRLEFLEDVKTKYNDVLVIYTTAKTFGVLGPFNEELISAMPLSVHYICHTGAGYDKIDVDACTARGIIVTNAPTAVRDATADLTTWLILGALRQLHPSINSLHRGDFNKGITLGHCPNGKVLGVIGFGRIGSAIKKRVEAFGMRVQYFNNLPLTAEQSDGATSVSFDELLASSDVISLHVPLNKETHHLISRKEIAKMKNGVVLVNASRGPVIDEVAMAEALDECKIAAVGLDVYEQEPIVHPKLLANDRALLVPHMGTQTVESTRKKEIEGMENARRAVLGMDLLSVVFEQQGKLPLAKFRGEEEHRQYIGCQIQM